MLYRERFYVGSTKFSSFREYRYIVHRYTGVLSHTFYCNFCRDIEYSALYREHRYIEDRYIAVSLYHNIADKCSCESMIFLAWDLFLRLSRSRIQLEFLG